ncbi:MAG: hypothetical protein ACOCUQ_03325 [Bacteroidota bacterium]
MKCFGKFARPNSGTKDFHLRFEGIRINFETTNRGNDNIAKQPKLLAGEVWDAEQPVLNKKKGINFRSTFK